MKKLCLILSVICMACPVFAATALIHVDQSNTNAPWDGSAANPFQTISEALDALALSNAVEIGGHTISVASGRYTETVYVYSNFHAGTPSAPNTLIGVGNPLIDAENARKHCVHIQMATNFVVKGFSMTGARSGWHGGQAVFLDNNNQNGNTENWTIDSCIIYGHDGSGVVSAQYVTGSTVTNSAFFLNVGNGILLGNYSSFNISKCVFLSSLDGVRKDRYGALVWIHDSVFAGIGGSAAVSTHNMLRMKNCAFYQNGGFIYDGGASIKISSIDDLHSAGYGIDNISADPGFADISGGDFTKLYEGSPCIGAGIDGGNIGLDTFSFVPISSNTYYVAPTGSDGYTREQAQNPATPWRTIQAGVNSVTAGDTLKISGGLYQERVVITNSGTSNHPISLIAEGEVLIEGTTSAIDLYRTAGVVLDGVKFKIRACSAAGVIVKESYGCRLANFDINIGTQVGAQGVRVDRNSGRNSYYKSIFHGHTGNNGTGVWISELHPGQDFESCDFFNNRNGIEMKWPRSLTRLYNCNFNNNTRAGVVQYVGSSLIRNCNFVSNGLYGIESRYGNGLPFAENCNFVGNGQYGAYQNSSGKTYFTNCNFYANTSGLLYDAATTTLITTIEALNSYMANKGNISTDPMFRNVSERDFKISPESGCVNAGTATTELLFDYYGNPRLIGPAVDIGVYEMPYAGTLMRFF